MVQSNIDLLCSKMQAYKETGDPLSLHYAFCALAVDVLSTYLWGIPLGNLRREDWGAPLVRSFRGLKRLGTAGKFLPGLFPFLAKSPDWLVAKMDPSGTSPFNILEVCGHIQRLI